MRRIKPVVFAAGLFALAINGFSQNRPDTGEVTLPLQDYENLLRTLAPPALPPEPPPTLSSATMEISLDEDVTRAELRFSARSETGKPTELSLGSDWPAEFQLVSPPTATLARRDSTLVLLLPGSGTWQVTLKASVPTERAGDRRTFQIPVPNFSAVEGNLSIPFPNADVKLTGATILSRKATGPKTVVAFASSQGLLFGSIRAAGGKKSGPLKYGAATISTEEHVDESVLRSNASVKILIESGRTERVEFSIPPDCDVLSVRGDAVAGFDKKEGLLTVRLGTPVTAESPGLHLQIALSKKFEKGRFRPPFPTFSAPSNYVLAFYPSETLELSLEEAGGFEDSEPGSPETGGISGGADDVLVARGVRAPVPPTYIGEKRREGKVLAVTIPEARFSTIASERGASVTSAEYVVQTRSKTALRITLPPGAEFWEADESGRPIVSGRESDGSLLLPLSSSVFRNRVRILYSISGAPWNPKEKLNWTLPAAAAPISRASWAVTLPDGWEAALSHDSAWHESGTIPLQSSVEEPSTGVDPEDERFIDTLRGETSRARRSSRGIVVTLPEERERQFAASLLEGVPPPLNLEIKKEKQEGGWR